MAASALAGGLFAISAVRRALQNCRPGATRRLAQRTEQLTARMAVLHLRPDDLALEDGGRFRDLQRLCERCGNKNRCAGDLASEFADPGWDEWRDYCPNATALAVSSALKGCRGFDG